MMPSCPSGALFSNKLTTLGMQMLQRLSTKSAAFNEQDDVLCNVNNGKGLIELNRPAALNALNLSMIRKIYPKMKEWASPNQASVKMVMMKGAGGKAFCAGGDVRSLAEGTLESTAELRKSFFKEEYRLNHLIGCYPIPYVAFIDGITMGGGVGLSVHGRFRVATERTLFAMPETAIGLFPDVGGGHFLPRLAGSLGMFLALTGQRLKGQDVYHAGIATHFVHSSKLPDLESELVALSPSSITSDSVSTILQSFHSQSIDNTEFSLKPNLPEINKLFSGSSVEQICAQLMDAADSSFAQKHLKTIQTMSPTALKVTHEQLTRGKQLNLADCLSMEYRISQRSAASHDFWEGVRATLIDKDKSPKWNPPTLAEVTPAILNNYFNELPAEDELDFTVNAKL